MYDCDLTPKQVIELMKSGRVSEKKESFINITQKLARIVKEYRKKYNLTNKELANRIGITTSILSRVENGNENLSMKTVCRVLDAIDYELIFQDKKG